MQQELPLDSGDKPAPPPAPKPKKPRAPRKPKPPARADMRLTAWLALAVIILDQALKYWVVHVMRLDLLREIDILPPWLNLRMAWNQGMNFGLLASDQNLTRWLLIVVAVAICLWVWFWVWRSAAGLLARISAGLLIGGAIGNVIDRLTYGAVADFLNMSLPGWQNPYSFNVADISIFAGAIGLILIPQNKPPARTSGKAAKPAGKVSAKGSAGKPRGPAPGTTDDKSRDEAGKSR